MKTPLGDGLPPTNAPPLDGLAQSGEEKTRLGVLRKPTTPFTKGSGDEDAAGDTAIGVSGTTEGEPGAGHGVPAETDTGAGSEDPTEMGAEAEEPSKMGVALRAPVITTGSRPGTGRETPKSRCLAR
jgi:hypothetical protein